MKLSFAGERVLAVVAHPDDAELFCAGTLARAKADGSAIGVCVLCKGDKGQPLSTKADLAAARKNEMRAAAKLLGAASFACDVPDGTLSDTRAERLKLLEVFRQFDPTVVLTHYPDDYHPDHCAAAKLAEAVSWLCASRGHDTPTPPMKEQPALWWMDTLNMTGFEPTLYVDISRYVSLKQRMLACHKSQMSRGKDANFTSLGSLMQLLYTTRGAQAGVAAAETFRPYQALKRTRAW